jgi:geranylgeranyl reductase family protein
MLLQQIPLASLPNRKWDVVVVGAGPAGAVCSLYLAKKGHKVLVVDKKKFPRSKACGDLLIPDSISMLKQVGMYDKVRGIAHEVSAIEVFSPSEIKFEIPGSYITLKREFLDRELMQYAREKGATFAHGTISDIKTNKNSSYAELYFSELLDNTILARTVVLATGGVTTLPHRYGLVSNKEPSAVALRCYIRSRYRQKNVIIYYHRSILPAYGWIIPLGKDSNGSWLYNVGYGTSYRLIKEGKLRPKIAFDTFLREFSLARLLMDNGKVVSPIQGAALRCGLTDSGPIQKNNVLAVGETIGTTFPFTGEGIGKAMESGKIAADIINDALTGGDMSLLSQYPLALNSKIKPRYSGYLKAEKWLSHRWLNDYVARRISKSKFLQERVQELMSERENPRSLFSVKSLFLSYLR